MSGLGKLLARNRVRNVTLKGSCMLRRYFGLIQEREHDVSEFLRCFFCKDCGTCKGTGVEDIRRKKVKETAPTAQALVN